MRVGQSVLYYPFVSHFMEQGPRAAIVAKVLSEKLVNLAVFDQHGVAQARQNVAVVAKGETPPNADYCVV